MAGEDCIVAFISSVVEKKNRVFDISIAPSNKNGLKVDSIIKINKIATLQKKTVLGELGLLETKSLDEVDKKIAKLFNL